MDFTRRGFLGAAVGVGTIAGARSWLEAAAHAAEQPKRRIKIGQIGTGHEHASAKMAAFRKLQDHYEVLGVAEPDPGRQQTLQKDPVYQGLRCMSVEELLSTPGLEAAAVELDSADPRLLDIADRCIQAGLHIHLDKPAGYSFTQFARLIDEARRRRLTVQLGYMYRNNPAVQFCQRAVREGWLGQVFEIHAVMSKFSPPGYRKYLSQFRGGVMFIYACHLIDLVVSLMGKPDRIVAFPRQTRFDVGVPVCDNGLIVLEYPKTTATIRTASLEVDGYRRRQLVVCGDEGTIDIRPLETFDIQPPPPLKLQLTLSHARHPYQKGSQEVTFPPPPGRYDLQLIELAQIIRGEKENPYPLDHELIVQQLLLEACGYPTKGK